MRNIWRDLSGDKQRSFDDLLRDYRRRHAAKSTDPLELQEELISAAFDGDLTGVRELLEQGVDVNGTGKYGVTPLNMAVENDNPNVVRFLLEHGAQVNLVAGWTALHHAVNGAIDFASQTHSDDPGWFRHIDWGMVRLLLDFGGSVAIPNDDGKSAFDFAKEYGSEVEGALAAVLRDYTRASEGKPNHVR